MAVSRLNEQVADWRLLSEYDQPARVLRNVALSGCESKNGYRYSEAALKRAARLYDQKPVFLDHAEKRVEPAARSTRDLVGSIINPRFDEGRLRGDVRVLDTDSGRTFLALVEANAPGVGMSHVVLARRSPDGALVESIEDVLSVDVVVRPATTSTFRESDQGAPAVVELKEVTPTGTAAMTDEPADGDTTIADTAVADPLSRIIDLLERMLTTLEERGGPAGVGTGVQEGTRWSREAPVPAGGRHVERFHGPRSAPRRELEAGVPRAAFVAAIRGR